MFKQSPSRNQRSKGFKVKHVLQICLLLAVCIWLLYQVKYSHDKKKAFDESNAKISEKVQRDHEILKLGRKDPHPHPPMEETVTEKERHEEEETEEQEEEEEENKHEVEESKSDESEDDGRGGRDDEIDERDQEKVEEEAEHGEDFIDEHDPEKIEEEAERGEDFVDEDEKDKEEKEIKEQEDQIEDMGSSEDQYLDKGDRITQEAREEQYKGDDASSAVVRDTDAQITAETGDKGLGNSNEEERTEKNELEQENKIIGSEEVNVDQNDSALKVGKGETAENSTSVNATASEEKGNGIPLSTVPTEPNDQPEVNNNSTVVNGKTPASSLQNGTAIILHSTQDQNATIEAPTSIGDDSNLQTENSNTTVGGMQSDSKATLSTDKHAVGELADSSSNSELGLPEEQTMKSSATAGAKDGSASSTTNENANVVKNEKSDADTEKEKAEERSVSSVTNENADAVQSDPIDSSDSSIPQEKKEARTDLETLPETKTEGNNSEEAAAE
ncbi:hypothetical protein HHK36_017597 [Tetracentron sinense]|uniref:Uncharacterized protein n=1 Tax=Tetracentron sinense TaxID=13715 RepID=A0A835DAH9_TETSI|nr:hypothetical protein HHK36_017597 [Tetracentron sinense]